MLPSNPIFGTGLHAIGGISAASCYLPQTQTRKWSWHTFWLVQALFAWIIMPIVVGWLTVPGFFNILANSPSKPFWIAFLLGAIYGFGGMSFGKAINHIGFSLTYTISIGISAVVGTILPLLIFGGLEHYFSRTGGNTVLTGMMLSMMGVALCGWAGFNKEKDIKNLDSGTIKFNMSVGLFLTIVAGVLSGVFNLSLEFGQPIADMAAPNGAGNYQGNAKMIISTSGCFAVNFIWFIIVAIRKKTLKEFIPNQLSGKEVFRNWAWSALAGTLWCMQFFFYGMGHVKMGNFQFTSWVLHMSMLIFFSYIVGLIMKEWKNAQIKTYRILIIGLIILVVSFCITSYGSYIGEMAIKRQIRVTEVASGKVYHTTMQDSAYLFERSEYAIFIPEGISTLRGIFIHQHGCTMEGIGASTAYDVQYHAFAKKWGLAVVGPDIFPKQGRTCHDWKDADSGSGDALVKALAQIAVASGHSELEHIPWLLWGHSGGGYWTLSMMKNYPERILAVFAYSPAFDPKWDYPQTAYKIPIMIRHAGANDYNDPGIDCWATALNTFTRLREHNGYISLAYNHGQNHNYSFVRHMAIPFYEAALAQRLPDNPNGKMNDMDTSKAWLGDNDTFHITPASAFEGNVNVMNWFPDSIVATRWREYVITGAIRDKTPPPVPYGLQMSLINDTLAVVTWKADADIESGIKYFNIRINDGQTMRFPVSEDYQSFDTNGDNAIPIYPPELKWEIKRPENTNKTVVFISTVNHSGLESSFSEMSFLWK